MHGRWKRRIGLAITLGAVVLTTAGGRADPIPAQKHCVGNPPRQSEDPMSPPCVPFFIGDNGAGTWSGVTGDEVRVVVYFDAGTYDGEVTPDAGTLLDIDDAPRQACPKDAPAIDCDTILVRAARAYATDFNARYQTYNRHVHYFAYFSGATSAGGRRADAAWLKLEVDPFAVLDEAVLGGYNDDFVDTMASRAVMVFASPALSMHGAAFFASEAPNVWSFLPDLEHRATLFASYVCEKIAPYPVAHMGLAPAADPHAGQPRTIGLWYPTSRARFASLVKTKLAGCGIDWGTDEMTFTHDGAVIDSSDDGAEQAAAVAKFKADDVTTVLWLGGVEGKLAAIADAHSYYPEIVIAGDEALESANVGRYQDQNVWKNAWALHVPLRIVQPTSTPAAHAYLEGDPNASQEDVRFGTQFFRDHYMVFDAIQLSGPKLSPSRVDQGFHAIPPGSSTNPDRAAFSFDPADYSGVKDAMELWWDPTGTHPADGRKGCMRMVAQGSRSRAVDWSGETTVFMNASDPCSGFTAPTVIRGPTTVPVFCALGIPIPIICPNA